MFSQEDPCSPPERKPRLVTPATDSLTIEPKKSVQHESNKEFRFSPEINTSKHTGLKVNIDCDIHEKLSKRFKNITVDLFIKDRTSFSFFTDSTLDWNIDQAIVGFELKSSNGGSINSMAGWTIESEKFKKFLKNRSLNSAFLSPGIVRLNSGFNYSLNESNEFSIGLASAKITWIRLKSLYDILEQDKIMGVSRNEPYLFEGGVSVKSNLKASISDMVFWEHSCILFYSLAINKYAEMEMLNKICFKVKDGIQTSLQSRYVYNEQVWPYSNWQTQLSIAYEL